MRYLMKKVANVGTGRFGLRKEAKFHGEAAGKTGTTSGWYDAWFAGFNTELTSIVWLGFDRRTISLGRHRSGGTIASPIWGRIMKDYYGSRGLKPPKFEEVRPKGVGGLSVCRYTGLLPKAGVCKKTIKGFFYQTQRNKTSNFRHLRWRAQKIY